MSRYILIIAPFIRSLWSLEAACATPSNVFIFWNAIGASLHELFSGHVDETGIPESLAQEVTAIFNRRWKEFFSNGIYFAAALLDPRYPINDILIRPATMTSNIILPPSKPDDDSNMPHPRAYHHVKSCLKELLKAEIDRAEKPGAAHIHPLLKQPLDGMAVALEFKKQLIMFWHGEYPFNAPLRAGQTALEWWEELEPIKHSQVLAMLAVKIFNMLPNSMPDERTGSKITWLNSPTRGNQQVQTLIDMIQVGQWYGDHQAEKRATERKLPTVKFRDLNADMLKAVQQHQEHIEEEHSASDSDSDDDVDDSGDAGSANVFRPRTDSLPLREEFVHADDDIDLTSPLIRDVLSLEPIPGVSRSTDTSFVPTSQPQPLDWSRI
ncbi:hypothetical protein PUNSTDRAFT_134619 [Punctularia strigosozonata HHB-11173 SS5]|uniref:uncharacterized protein n=1 Tax=Punctularia strigosozonata (strain HHB-11173) TaxID=741275 RepID=UPI000441652B|nr:uncharacterized protein PUNSTDRAFT_134619 [Punctularia strigosozonata HHB-11173 SS5]EIN08230.1 hypothetical protein PUNSTDRAFT_134619 [Punctularia strigosozonata HHB-11173 SS5]